MRGAWATLLVLASLSLAGEATAQQAFQVALPKIQYALVGEPLDLAPGECATTLARVFNLGNESAALRFGQLQAVDGENGRQVAFKVAPSTAIVAGNASVDLTIHACAFPDADEGKTNLTIDVVLFPPGAPVGSFLVPASVSGAPGEWSLPAPFWWTLVAAGGAVASWLTLRRIEWLQYAALGALAPLYTRLAPSRLLEQEKREAIYRLIEQEPGIHFSALLTQTALPNGVLVHHLRQLERHKLVVSRREGALRRFAASPAEFPPLAPKPLTPMQMRVMGLLAEGPRTQREIATALGLTQQGANRHVKTLERRGLLAIRYQDGEWRCHPTTPALQS